MTCATTLRIHASVACARNSVAHMCILILIMNIVIFIFLYLRQRATAAASAAAAAASSLCMCVCVFESVYPKQSNKLLI
jgi:hypothetical protein